MSKGGGHQSTHPPSRVCAMKRFWWVVVIKELARNAKGYCPPYYTLRQFGSKKVQLGGLLRSSSSKK